MPRFRWDGESALWSATAATALAIRSTSGVDSTCAVVAAVRPQPVRLVVLVGRSTSTVSLIAPQTTLRRGSPSAGGPGTSIVTMSANETLMSVCDAALFDLDGVLTPTAEVHMHAWARMFNEYLAARRGLAFVEAQAERPRRTPTPTTSPTSTASPATTGCATSSRPAASSCPGATRPTRRRPRRSAASATARTSASPPCSPATASRPTRARCSCWTTSRHRGVAVAVVSSSQNADAVLTAAGLRDRFEVVVDGRLAHAEGLPGEAGPRHLPPGGRGPRRAEGACGRVRGRRLRHGGRTGRRTSASSSGWIAASARRRCSTREPTWW